MSIHAIITGGSSGIGKAVAKLLLEQGNKVTLIARCETKLNQVVAEFSSVLTDNEQLDYYSADVADEKQIHHAIKQATDSSELKKVLILSAGLAEPGYFESTDTITHKKSMDINYFGSLYPIQAILPHMKKAHSGHIVMISSGAGLVGIHGYTSYSPSKFALQGLAESMRSELKNMGINLSIAFPPDTDTPMLEQEMQTKPPETCEITGSGSLYSPEFVAKSILNGINKKKFSIYPGKEMYLLGKLHSFIYPVLNWYFDRIIGKHQKR
ncbi:short-chain dehydrogenase [Shewanella sp. OPT22]|nr:short-chain dehydrogenase [Shewanella sp. OPT22]